jgi:hypothetical protein
MIKTKSWPVLCIKTIESQIKQNKMKKFVFLLITGVALATGAIAQSSDVKDDKKDLKNSIRDKQAEKKDTRKDVGHLKIKSAMKENKEVGQDRRTIHQQGKHLDKQHGVKHPIVKAKHEVHEEKEAKKDKD